MAKTKPKIDTSKLRIDDFEIPLDLERLRNMLARAKMGPELQIRKDNSNDDLPPEISDDQHFRSGYT